MSVINWCTVILLSLVNLPAEAKMASNCQDQINTCEYYSCKSNALQCNEQNYLERFALKYCNKFDTVSHRFTKNGQKILNQVKSCLQIQMEQVAESQLSCETVEGLAFDHHFKCYIESGYCELDPGDRGLITLNVLSALFDLNFLEIALNVKEYCLNYQ